MEITTVLFDLDGTLLPMDLDTFVKAYFSLLAKKLAPLGYETQELVQTIWAGTAAMVKNNGEKTNEEAFWEVFCAHYGQQARKDEPVFAQYYHTDFAKAQSVCGFHPKAAEVVKKVKEKGKRVALATNPIFPAIATESRIRWAGLQPEDFELYTTYENSNYCKPNLNYYRQVLEKLGVQAEACLMVGNDVTEDMVARELGMQVFLLTDCLINKNNADISCYPHGGFEALLAYIEEL